MSNTKVYEKARKNVKLLRRKYTNLELYDIVTGQFHYFWYKLNLGYNLEHCAYQHWTELEKNEIKKIIVIFRKKNIQIFKNQLKLFNIVLLHLLLNQKPKNNRIHKI